MKQLPIGSYEEARVFALRRFSRLSSTQKVMWLSKMDAFIKEGRANLQFPTPRKKSKR
ncbi:MAG: hypothetical protein HYZ89_01175 [Candidatus Omnitrophica bacterium]|nr:hypothetical protein [Candidatus Omnitrophota bacterium]